MANIKIAYPATSTATITLASLASGSGRGSTAISNSSNLYLDGVVYVEFKTGASGVSTTGHLDVYIIKSPDGTNYDDGFSGTDSAWTPNAATYLFSIPAVASATSYYGSERISKVEDFLTNSFAIGILNNTGAALDSTAANFTVIIAPDYLTSV